MGKKANNSAFNAEAAAKELQIIECKDKELINRANTSFEGGLRGGPTGDEYLSRADKKIYQGSFKVGNGMECTEQIVEQNIDVITQLLVQMDAVNTRTSEEALERHVEKYLTENPPTFSDQQVSDSVDDYLKRNPLELD